MLFSQKILLILILAVSASFSQELKTIYDNAPDDVKSRKSFQRERWFYEQRMFPYNFLPDDAFGKAQQQRSALRYIKGYFFKDNYWFSIGPAPAININYGNVASRVASVKFNPLDPQIIYLAAACGGVWKSTNGGLSWVPKSDFEISLSSGALALDPVDPDIIYCGTGEATYFTYSYYGRGLLKSTDGGNNWVSYKNGLPDMTYFSRIAVSPLNRNKILAALGSAGLYKSTDAGQSWIQVIAGRCDDIIFSPDGNRAYCIGDGSGYRISTNGGDSFTPYSVFTLGGRNHIAICRSAPNVIYASTYASGGVSVYKSINSGTSFSMIYNAFTGYEQGWYDFYIHVNPFDPDNAYVGLIDLWRTLNGKDFYKITNTSAGPVHVDHHNMDFHPNDAGKLICANDGGVWYSTNRGTNWTNLNSTLNLTQFYRVTSDPADYRHLIGGTQDNGTQRTTGNIKWDVVFGGDGGEVSFDSKDSKYVLAENQYNGVRRSQDGGVTWVAAATGLTGTAAWIAPVISHPDSSGIFYTARQRLFKTTNYGVSWFGYSVGTSDVIRELAISKSNPKIIFASINNNIYKSNDGGQTFSILLPDFPSRIITSVSIHPDSSDVAMVTFSGFNTGHIYRTTNGGLNWSDVSGNLPNTPVNDALFYYPGYSTSIFLAATDVGVFMTNDYGANWSELSAGLPNTVCLHLDYNLSAKKLRTATHGRGIWEFSGEFVGIVNRNSLLADEFRLFHNYPNPFNNETIIKFQITETGYVTLRVYDLLGREVSVLVDETLNSGSYEVSFNGSSLAGGVYFYRLITGNKAEAKKMMLIK